MRKILTICAGILVSASLFAGGLVTNTNQSAMFTRLQNRNASTGIDAVYYNPAGLTSLKDGFHLSINNQTISQTQTIGNNYQFLSGSPKNYEGKVSAPFFPSIYAAYKSGKWAFSAGFNPIGGGGGAKYNSGLPTFELPISGVVPLLVSKLAPLDQAFTAVTGNNPGFENITGYTSNIYFKGTSVYFGFQANVSYAFNDIISAAIGGRYVTAKNTYSGYIKDVKINAPAIYGGSQIPGDYLRFIASVPGVPANTQALLNGTAVYLDGKTNVEADAEMKGSGFAPILSLNITPSEQFNIAVRYEFKTKLNLKTTVNSGKDGDGLFMQDSVAIADIPAMLAVGVNFKPIKNLLLSGSFNYYWDKKVDYDGQEKVEVNMIDKNFIEFGLGAEYGINDKLRISGGWVHTITGVNSNYQSDMSYSTNTNSFGAGIGYRITPMIDLNIGGQYTFYATGKKGFPADLTKSILDTYTETYAKKTWLIGIGLDFYFGK